MDVLANYLESKEMIKAVAKGLFAMLEANDPFGIIRHSDIVRLEIAEHQKDDSLVLINLMNFNDETPRVTFESPRDVALALGEEIIKLWIEASKALIARTYFAVINKFLRDNEEEHYEIINAAIQVAPTLSRAGKTNTEIAKIVSEHMTTKLANKVLQKECTTE